MHQVLAHPGEYPDVLAPHPPPVEILPHEVEHGCGCAEEIILRKMEFEGVLLIHTPGAYAQGVQGNLNFF